MKNTYNISDIVIIDNPNTIKASPKSNIVAINNTIIPIDPIIPSFKIGDIVKANNACNGKPYIKPYIGVIQGITLYNGQDFYNNTKVRAFFSILLLPTKTLFYFDSDNICHINTTTNKNNSPNPHYKIGDIITTKSNIMISPIDHEHHKNRIGIITNITNTNEHDTPNTTIYHVLLGMDVCILIQDDFK